MKKNVLFIFTILTLLLSCGDSNGDNNEDEDLIFIDNNILSGRWLRNPDNREYYVFENGKMHTEKWSWSGKTKLEKSGPVRNYKLTDTGIYVQSLYDESSWNLYCHYSMKGKNELGVDVVSIMSLDYFKIEELDPKLIEGEWKIELKRGDNYYYYTSFSFKDGKVTYKTWLDQKVVDVPYTLTTDMIIMGDKKELWNFLLADRRSVGITQLTLYAGGYYAIYKRGWLTSISN